ncbi:MAG: hypothetical protein IJD13_02305, partial [Oscillospiraceae bacterium]|nr:hypothetical protein [Oscillospiraceae bacterium]
AGFANDDEFSAFRHAERLGQIADLSCEEQKKMLAWMTGIREKYGISRFPLDPEGEDIDAYLRGCGAGEYLVGDGSGAKIPAAFFRPDNWDGSRICLALSGEGKLSGDHPAVQKLLAEGTAVFTGSLYSAPRSTVKYFTCYNYTDACLQAQETAVLWQAMTQIAPGAAWSLYAETGAAAPAACALPLLKGAQSALLDEAAVSAAEADLVSDCFIPGIPLLGGIRGALKLSGADVKFF